MCGDKSACSHTFSSLPRTGLKVDTTWDPRLSVSFPSCSMASRTECSPSPSVVMAQSSSYEGDSFPIVGLPCKIDVLVGCVCAKTFSLLPICELSIRKESSKPPQNHFLNEDNNSGLGPRTEGHHRFVYKNLIFILIRMSILKVRL